MEIYVAHYLDDDCHEVDRYFRDKNMAIKQIKIWKKEQESGDSSIFHISDEPSTLEFSDNDIYNKYFRK